MDQLVWAGAVTACFDEHVRRTGEVKAGEQHLSVPLLALLFKDKYDLNLLWLELTE